MFSLIFDALWLHTNLYHCSRTKNIVAVILWKYHQEKPKYKNFNRHKKNIFEKVIIRAEIKKNNEKYDL